MSFEDTHCPCGGKKERETMLCAECVEWLKDKPAMKAFLDETCAVEYRRQAAIILVTLARKRKRAQEPQGRFSLSFPLS